MDDIKVRIEKQRLLKRHYDLEYWKNDIKFRSDEIYDQIKDVFDKMLEEHPEYRMPEDDKLESIHMNTFAEVRHRHKMMSLGKALSVVDYIKWHTPLRIRLNLAEDKTMIFEFKIDGFAIAIEYEDGKFVRASTRGDGEIGDDITATVFLIPDVPRTLPDGFTGEVGGEIYMKKSSLIKINEKLISEGKKPLKNVRNAASGVGRKKDTTARNAEFLSFLCYRYVKDDHETDTYIEEMNAAKELGFKTVFHDLNGILIEDPSNLTDKQIEDIFQSFQDKRDALDLDIDGVVIKINDKILQAELGEKLKIPNWAIAYKFPAIEKLTTLLEVEWDLGAKDGRLTPMAKIEHIDIGGTTVKRPTLCNWDEIQRLGARVGCTLRVSRRGDVIPKVEEVIHELDPDDAVDIQIPKCPVCETLAVIDGAHLKCPNPECSGKITGKVRIFVNAMEIEELGVTTIDKLVEADKLQSITDLFKLSESDISNLDKMGEKSAKKILANIEGCKKQPLWRVIAGLSIKMVGVSTSKVLEKTFGSLENLKNVTTTQLVSINDIGNVVSGYIIGWFANTDNIALIDELIELGLGTTVEKIEVKENKLDGAKIAFTGKLSRWSRTECEKVIQSVGGEVWAIKKELDYLLIGEGAKPAKVDKAKGLGAKVISETEFLELIK